MSSTFVPDPAVVARAVALADAALHGRAPMPVSRDAVRAQWYVRVPRDVTAPTAFTRLDPSPLPFLNMCAGSTSTPCTRAL